MLRAAASTALMCCNAILATNVLSLELWHCGGVIPQPQVHWELPDTYWAWLAWVLEYRVLTEQRGTQYIPFTIIIYWTRCQVPDINIIRLHQSYTPCGSPTCSSGSPTSVQAKQYPINALHKYYKYNIYLLIYN